MSLSVVAGLSLRNLEPRVWDPTSRYYLPQLQAVMVSYAELNGKRVRSRVMASGLGAFLHVPDNVKVYLDNGAFFFIGKGREVPRVEYEEFVHRARPDWYAIPQDYIPTPRMDDSEQRECLRRTMEMNCAYAHDGYVPVVHVSRYLDEYMRILLANERLRAKPVVALGGIVPNLLRATKAMPYSDVLDSIRNARTQLVGQQLHIFGIGGTATLHIAALFDVDSVDSCGWRNRAARGIIQLPGCGDRVIADLGNWRGRKANPHELELLSNCPCPACQQFGLSGLRASGLAGFSNRATHNLWTLLEEAREITNRLNDGTYAEWFRGHLNNSTYLPLIERTLDSRVSGQV